MVNGFNFSNSVINGVNGNNAAADEGSVSFSELTGSASESSTSISGGFEDNFRVVNTSGTLNRITFTSVTIGANSTADGNDGIILEALTGAAILNATIEQHLHRGPRRPLHLPQQRDGHVRPRLHGEHVYEQPPGHRDGRRGRDDQRRRPRRSLTYDISGNSFRTRSACSS